MLHLIIGPAGSGKTTYARKLSTEIAQNKNSDVILLVPEQYSFETERALIKTGVRYPDSRLEVLSFTSLCRRVFEEHGGLPGKCLPKALRPVAMALAVMRCRDNNNYLLKLRSITQASASLSSLYSEFKLNGTDPQTLEMIALSLPDGSLKDKTKGLSEVFSLYEATVENGFSNDERLLERLVSKADTPVFLSNKTVICDGFKGFTGEQIAVLELMIKNCADVYITLCTDNLSRNDSNAVIFDNVKKTATELINFTRANGITVAAPVCFDRSFRNRDTVMEAAGELLCGYLPTPDKNDGTVTVKKCKTRYDEAEFIACTVREMLFSDSSLRCRDIAVIARTMDHYSAQLSGCFSKYRLPLHIDARRPLFKEPPAVLILSALSCVSSGFSAEDFFAALKSGASDITQGEASRLENYMYLWRLSNNDIRKPFTHNPSGAKKGFTAEQTAELDELNLIRERAVEPFVLLYDDLRKATVGADKVKALYDFLLHCKTDSRIKELRDTAIRDGRPNDADASITSYNMIMDILSGMYELLRETPLDNASFYELMAVAVRSSDMGLLPQGLDEISAGSADRMRPHDPKIVFIIGANDTVFPRTPASGGILSDRERKILKTAGLRLSDRCEEDLCDEEFLFYSSLCAASQKVYITFCEVNNKGESMDPSSPVTKICALLNTLDSPTTTHENRILDVFPRAWADLGAAEDTAKILTCEAVCDECVFTANSLLDEGVIPKNIADVVRSGLSDRHESLRPDKAKELFGDTLSLNPSAIDVFYKCRFNYFCKHGLSVKPLEAIDLTAQLKGTIIHYVLEHVLTPTADFSQPEYTCDQLKKTVRKLLYEYVDGYLGGFDDKPQSFVYTLRTIEKQAYETIERLIREIKTGRFKIYSCEQRIGKFSEIPARVLPFGTTGSISITGVVDRIDICEQQGKCYFRILDYKTGIKKLDLDEVYKGLGMQMLLYLFSVDKHIGKKTGMQTVPSGVLYIPARNDAVRSSAELEGDDLTKASDKIAKFSGLILNEPEVISIIGGKDNLFMPYSYKTDGDFKKGSSVADRDTFNHIKKTVDERLVSMGEKLHSGDIAADVLDPKGKNGCQYCDYKSVCRHAGTAKHRTVAGTPYGGDEGGF